MLSNQFRVNFKSKSLPIFSLVLLAALINPTRAHADSYLYAFDFSVSSILAANDIADASHDERAYYNIFFQPTDTSLTIVGGFSPVPSGTDELQVSSAAVPGLTTGGIWEAFTKLAATTEISVLSDANGGPLGSNIFLGASITPTPLANPPGWGDPVVSATVDQVLPGSDKFTVLVSSPSQLTYGTYESFSINMIGIDSTSADSYAPPSSNKSEEVTFDLSALVTPEPSAAIPCLAAALLLGAFARKRRLRAGVRNTSLRAIL